MYLRRHGNAERVSMLEGRRLVCAAVSAACAMLVSHYITGRANGLICAAVCAAPLVILLIQPRKRTNPAAVMLIAAVFAFTWTWANYELFIAPAKPLAGQNAIARFEILDYPSVGENCTLVSARLAENGLPKAKTEIYSYSDALDGIEPGDVITAGVQFGKFSEANLEDGYALHAYYTGDFETSGESFFYPLAPAKRLANAVKEKISDAFPNDVTPLMTALMTGDRTLLYGDGTLYSDMRIAGVAHIVAVSGMHVAFIAGMIRLLVGRANCAKLGIPLILTFMALTGFGAPVVRAGIMQICLLLAPPLRREYDPPTVLCAALLLLLLHNPESIGSPGLQLSFAATFGIIWLTPNIFSALMGFKQDGVNATRHPLHKALAASVAAGLGASVFTLPLSAIHFGYLPLYGVLSTLLCVPAASGAFALGYILCALDCVLPSLASALGAIAAWLPRWIAFVAEKFASLPFAAVYTRGNALAWWLAGSYILIFSTAALPFSRRRAILSASLCAAALAVVLAGVHLNGARDVLRVAALDVGQGECVAVSTADAAVIVDCGSLNGDVDAADTALQYLARLGRSGPDALLLTHTHTDHANGAKELVASCNTGIVIMPEGAFGSALGAGIADTARSRGTALAELTDDETLTFGALNLTLYEMDGEMIIRGVWNGSSFLIMGDADSKTERELVEEHAVPDTDILIVGHHGSAYSTCGELLDAVSPRLAIISVGENSFSHPAQETLDALAQRNIPVARTDTDGTVYVESDGAVLTLFK